MKSYIDLFLYALMLLFCTFWEYDCLWPKSLFFFILNFGFYRFSRVYWPSFWERRLNSLTSPSEQRFSSSFHFSSSVDCITYYLSWVCVIPWYEYYLQIMIEFTKKWHQDIFYPKVKSLGQNKVKYTCKNLPITPMIGILVTLSFATGTDLLYTIPIISIIVEWGTDIKIAASSYEHWNHFL